MKKTTNAKKNSLDERQEQALLKSESKGFWMAFWLLAIVILAQLVLQFANLLDKIPAMMPEWVVFMVMCVYMIARCQRDNVWDRRLKPNFGTNLLLSLIAGAVIAALCFLMVFIPTRDVIDSLIGAGFGFVGTAGTCLVFLSIFAASYKRKRARLEQEEAEEGNKE